eukprot:COSAG01_NODE_1834_length_9105_cov_35.595603_3_plen_290_part_00
MGDLAIRIVHDCVCSLNAKFDRHETPLRALQACCQLIGLASSTENCLMHSRRTLPNGDPDPTDTSKQRPDLVIYDFHNGGPNPTLVDITVTHPTARCHSRLPERIGVAARSRELGRAAQLRAWLVGDDLNIDDYGRPGGASPFLVPLAHHGLRHNAIVLPARTLYHRHGPQDAALAREWGGSVIENAWFRVVAEAGLHEQWHALLFVAVTAVRTLVEEHSVAHVHTFLEGHMREDGYVGWMQQRVLLGARFDADAARNAYSRASEVIRMARGRLRGELAMPDDELGTDS